MIPFRSAGLLLAELSGLQFTRREINAKLSLAADMTERLIITEAAEKHLRQALAIEPRTDFRKNVIEALLHPDPKQRMSVSVAYTITQQLLNVCVVKLSQAFEKIAPYRQAFWKRLQHLFAVVAATQPEHFQLLRTVKGSAIFQFRITGLSTDTAKRVFDELQKQASDPNSVLRRQELGNAIVALKKWEESDGAGLFNAFFT